MTTVLALRALGLGDLCTGVPTLRALRTWAPDARLVLAAPAWQSPIATALGIDEVLPTDGLRAGIAWPAGEPVDLAVNLHGVGPQSTRLLLGLRPGRALAFRHRDVPETGGAPEWHVDEHDRLRWCRLLAAAGVPADPHDFLLPPPTATSPIAPATVIVHPGAAAPARRWPAARFAAVVAALRAGGYRVALTGTAEERPLCERVAGGNAQVLAGRTDVAQLAAAVATAAAVVTNDTGVAHLASAYRIPSVVLFGPTPPSRWGPPGDGPHRTLWAGSIGDPHGSSLDPGLAAIGVGEVLVALSDVLASGVRQRSA